MDGATCRTMVSASTILARTGYLLTPGSALLYVEISSLKEEPMPGNIQEYIEHLKWAIESDGKLAIESDGAGMLDELD